MTVNTMPLPRDSLLAERRGEECYRDAFMARVDRPVTLGQFLTAFYSSTAFMPERKLLGVVNRDWRARSKEIAALAEGRATRFAAWTVEARTEDQLLMQDHRDHTCSWFRVEPTPSSSGAAGQQTHLWFGSGVRRPDGAVVSALMPFHRWYSRVLLAGAAKAL